MKSALSPFSRRAFTLIELLTVIAIIGILAAIIIPTVSNVKIAANKSKTKVQFNQWAVSIGMFKQDYGFYPFFGTTRPTRDESYTLSDATSRQMFYDILAGKKPDGSALPSSNSTTSAVAQNKRRVAYYSFSNEELESDGAVVRSIQDAFGNSEIRVMIDYNYDDLIPTSTAGGAIGSITGGVRSGNDLDGYGRSYIPDTPSGGIRGGVIFYSAGNGSGKKDIVTSW